MVTIHPWSFLQCAHNVTYRVGAGSRKKERNSDQRTEMGKEVEKQQEEEARKVMGRDAWRQ